MFVVFIIGTAGSGKSTLTSTLSNWLEDHDISTITVNLDPAVDELPYEPDVDVRDYITVDYVMKKYKLGPNGAIIAAIDMIASKIEDIHDEINSYKAGYVLIDTPGQMELFAFRTVGEYIVSFLKGERAATIYLVDAALAIRPSGFLSSMLLAASIYYRFGIAHVNVLNKIDLVGKELVERINSWLEDPERLRNDLIRERRDIAREVNESILNALKDYLSAFELIPISAKTGEGIDNLYAVLQQIYLGGEDYTILP